VFRLVSNVGRPSAGRVTAPRRIGRWVASLMLVGASLGAQEKIDGDVINKIKAEEASKSQIMDIMSYLTDVYGPRLTGSPNAKAAGEWTLKQFNSWGLANAKMEPWGPFGRGWSNDRFVAQVVSPRPFPVIGYPSAWTPGTNGPVRGEVVIVPADTGAGLEAYRGKLRGKIVFTQNPRDDSLNFRPDAHRLEDGELARLDTASPPAPNGGRGGRGGRGGGPGAFQAAQEAARKRMQLFVDEGVVALVSQPRGDMGTVFTNNGGSRDAKNPTPLPQVFFAMEHYGRIAREVQKGVPVTLELDIKNTYYDDDPNSFNLIAEIPGTDPKLKDEVVMLGAHFDSWHAGTGATDNAAGSAVMIEAMRLIKTLGLKPRRTIRIGLWTGEEQGLLGSRAYVKEHFGDPQTMQLKPAHEKFAGYFNLDNGSGAIRGVYLQGNDAVRPIFKQWLEAFGDKSMNTLTILNTGGTDHLSYDAVGLPGFQFIQDGLEYGTRTHHSNMDVYERIAPDDMKHNAAVVAAFVWLTAQRDQKLPRKPLPAVTQ
jgi:carboxypeptidase Q